MYRLHFLHCSKLLQSCPTLWDLLDGSLPGSSVLGIHQARILDWVAISYFRGSSQPRNQAPLSCISRQITAKPAEKPHNNYKGRIYFKNCDFLYCTLVTYIIFYINYTSIKKKRNSDDKATELN